MIVTFFKMNKVNQNLPIIRFNNRISTNQIKIMTLMSVKRKI